MKSPLFVIDDEVHRHPEEALLSELSVVVANEDKKEAAASRSKARYGELSARPLLRGWIVTAGLFKVWMTRSPTVHPSATKLCPHSGGKRLSEVSARDRRNDLGHIVC